MLLLEDLYDSVIFPNDAKEILVSFANQTTIESI